MKNEMRLLSVFPTKLQGEENLVFDKFLRR